MAEQVGESAADQVKGWDIAPEPDMVANFLKELRLLHIEMVKKANNIKSATLIKTIESLNYAVQEVWMHKTGYILYCDSIARVLERAAAKNAVCYADLNPIHDFLGKHPSRFSRFARPPTPDTQYYDHDETVFFDSGKSNNKMFVHQTNDGEFYPFTDPANEEIKQTEELLS